MSTDRPFFKHFVAEIYGVEFALADSPTFINKKMRKLLAVAKIPLLKSQKNLFQPQGLSIVYILGASHLAVHTWPENGYVHLDLLTCSEETDFGLFEDSLRHEFEGLVINSRFLEY